MVYCQEDFNGAPPLDTEQYVDGRISLCDQDLKVVWK